MAMYAAAGSKFNLNDICDERLYNLVEKTEDELRNVNVMERFPHHAKTVQDRYLSLVKEVHRRKLRLCLTEICTLQHFKKTRRLRVTQWLRKINLDDIEALHWSD